MIREIFHGNDGNVEMDEIIMQQTSERNLYLCHTNLPSLYISCFSEMDLDKLSVAKLTVMNNEVFILQNKTFSLYTSSCYSRIL